MKKVISVLVLAVLCLSLAGCNSEDGPLYSYDDLSEYVEVGKVTGLESDFEVAPVTQDAVDAFINSALSKHGYGESKTITDRAVKNGDTVNIDFEGKKDGVAFEGGTAKGYELVIGSNSFIDGFESGLVGANVGQTLDLNLTFPENYGSADLAGQAVVFTVKVNSIKATVYPELTDTLVDEISDCTTVEEYEEYVNGQVLVNNQDTAVKESESQLWELAAKKAKVKKVPERETEFFEKYLREQEEKNASSGGMSLDAYIEYLGMTEDEFDKQINALAKQYAEYYLINVAIARDQDIDVSDEDYNKAIEQYAADNHYTTVKEAEDAIDGDLFRLSLVADNVLNYIVENAVQK